MYEEQSGVWSTSCAEGRLSVEVGFQWRVEHVMMIDASFCGSIYIDVRRTSHREAE